MPSGERGSLFRTLYLNLRSMSSFCVLDKPNQLLPRAFSLLETPHNARHIHRLPQLSAGERRTAAWRGVGCPAQRKFIHRVAASLGHHLITEVCQELNNSWKFLLSFLDVCYQRRKKQQLVGLKHLDELHLLDTIKTKHLISHHVM